MAFMPSRSAARLSAPAVVALALTAATAPARADGHYVTFGAGPDTVGSTRQSAPPNSASTVRRSARRIR